MSAQIQLVKKYVSLVESLGLDEHSAAELMHSDYEQWELPNQLNKAGQKCDRADSIRRMQAARKMLATQKYEISTILEQGKVVVMEAAWSGVMAIDAGPLKRGQTMKAFFCMFFEFKDEKIHRVRNYDCFEALG